MAIIIFFNHQKKIPCNFIPMIPQAKVCVADITQKCCGHYIFGNTFFIIHFLVSIVHCGYANIFCSYLSKNEAVKLLFTLFNMFYCNILQSPADLVSCNASQIFFCYSDSKINFITSQVNVVSKKNPQ